MSIDEYRNTIDNITATETFKNNVIKKMQQSALENLQTKQKTNRKLGVPIVITVFVILAACLIIPFFSLMQNKDTESDITTYSDVGINTELPKLTIEEDNGACGYEAYMAYTIDDLKNGNPWTEDNELTVLPVFKNVLFDDEIASIDQLKTKIEQIADYLEVTINNFTIHPTEEEIKKEEQKTGIKNSDSTPYNIVADCGNVEIEGRIFGDIFIRFKEGISFTDEHNITGDITRAQAEKSLDFLIDKYINITGIKSPEKDIEGDYNIYARLNLNLGIFENSGNLTEKILGYNFKTAGCYVNENGKIDFINFNIIDQTSEIIGNYPIITAEEAKKLLLEKHYITTVPEDITDEKYIKKVELIYKHASWIEFFMPYYRFLVELPPNYTQNGLKSFGAYYVPAVKSEYLTNMPVAEAIYN